MTPPAPASTSRPPKTLDMRKAPRRFTRSTVSQASTGMSTTGTRSGPRAAPALFTTKSTRPNSASVRSSRSRTEASSPASLTRGRARWPAASISAATEAMSFQPAAFSSSG